jgi:hypothetical protein
MVGTSGLVTTWEYLRPKLKALGVRDPMLPETIRKGYAHCRLGQHWVPSVKVLVDGETGFVVGCPTCTAEVENAEGGA